MRYPLHIVCHIIFWTALTLPAAAGEFITITTPSPPYSVSQCLRVKGISVTVLSELMKMTGIPFNPKKVRLLPWARAFQEAETKSHRILLNIPRSPRLENSFKWVGPLTKRRFVVIAKKGTALTIDTLADATKYKIATIRDSGPEKVLVSKGADKSKIQQNTTHVQALRGLDANAVELFAHSDLATAYFMTGLGLNPKNYRIVNTYFEEEIYYAFSKDTDDTKISKLNQALNTIKTPSANGISRFEEIVAEYLPNGKLE